MDREEQKSKSTPKNKITCKNTKEIMWKVPFLVALTQNCHVVPSFL